MRSLQIFAMSVFATLALLSSANATITFPFNTVHSGGVPAGTPTWATMIIQDVPGGVLITLTHNPTSASGQFIGRLHLKFNRVPTGFDFTGDPFVTNINLGGYINAGLSFNTEVRFRVAPPASRLLPGRTATFRLFGVSESDFAGQISSAMVHIQGLPGGESSKVIAPEPASMIALGTGIAGLLGLSSRRKKSSRAQS